MTRHLYTIPPSAPFLKTLAEELVRRAGGFTPELAHMLVLLPTRRACRSLRQMFLELSAGKPLLLPRLQPLGDVDQDELELNLAGLYGIEGIPDIPPAISKLRRLFLLTQLIQKRDPEQNFEQALELAGSLAALIDQTHTEDLDFKDLPELVPPDSDLSEHWQEILKFLYIVTDLWPEILKDYGLIDPADRRNRLMKTLADYWEHQPPAFPVIAAGSTGSIPATARLLDLISKMPNGAVVLPGVDLELDQASWDQITDTHPQATLKALLQQFEFDRYQLKTWGVGDAISTARSKLATEIMRPAETVQNWAQLETSGLGRLATSLEKLTLIEARNLSDEAQIIAVIMREALETPDKKAALVTPDRALARRVSSALRQWGINVDDSAGLTLSMSAAGSFILAVLNCVTDDFAPLSLLNLLKHPKCHPLVDHKTLQDFEVQLCRGPRPAAGMNGLRSRLGKLEQANPALSSLLDQLEQIFQPLQKLNLAAHRLDEVFIAVSAISEALAGGRAQLWVDDDGEAASHLITEIMLSSSDVPPITLGDCHALLGQIMGTISVRTPETHSRLLILGQLEARMIDADVIILGGLNEKTWPAEAQHDPWMSRPMRKKFGLPSPEKSIGLAAHDFVQGLCNPCVVLTRSLKIEGAQTVPSRWLQRMETLLTACKLTLAPDTTYAALVQHLQHTGQASSPATRPQPRPPVDKRPRKLSVTAIEKWMKNPYQLYVEKILKLVPLDPIDANTDVSDRGTFVHAILEEFIKLNYDTLAPDAYDQFICIARTHMADMEATSPQWQFWWPRIEQMGRWFVEHEQEWRQSAQPWLLETIGTMKVPYSLGDFTVTAKADRIDCGIDGTGLIIDYKTGTPPTGKKIKEGKACQLPLEGLILESGGFGERKLAVSGLYHWKLLSAAGGEIAQVKDHAVMMDIAKSGFQALLEEYAKAETPYTAQIIPEKELYADGKAIAHLARVAEWGHESEDDSEDAA